MWPGNRVLDLLGVELPIIQAPMTGAMLSDMVVAVSEAGGLGSLPCALLSFEQARGELEVIRRKPSRPINVNFFWHQQPPNDPALMGSDFWRESFGPMLNGTHEVPFARQLQDALALPIFDGGNMGIRRRQLHTMFKQSNYDPLAASGATP
jgi:NAD(P)H-dependent flavin oxidoreductase YrpB (nitropropane dioxygenase family)